MFYFCGYIFASLDTAYCELKRAGRFRCLLANCENFQFLPLHFRCHRHIYFYYWLFLSLYAISIFLNISHSKLIYPFFFFNFHPLLYMIDTEELQNKPIFVETISICDSLVSGYLYLFSMDVNCCIFFYKCCWFFIPWFSHFYFYLNH